MLIGVNLEHVVKITTRTFNFFAFLRIRPPFFSIHEIRPYKIISHSICSPVYPGIDISGYFAHSRKYRSIPKCIEHNINLISAVIYHEICSYHISMEQDNLFGVNLAKTFFLAQTRLLSGDHKVRCCIRASIERHHFYSVKNRGKKFYPATVPYDQDVELCMRLLCVMLSDKVFHSESDALHLLERFRLDVLPRFYQDAVHVRKELMLSTFDRSAIKCVYPSVCSRVECADEMKGRRLPCRYTYIKEKPMSPRPSHVHVPLTFFDIYRAAIRNALAKEDGSSLLLLINRIHEIGGDKIMESTNWSITSNGKEKENGSLAALRELANHWAFRPGSPWQKAAAQRFRVEAREYSVG